MTTTLTRLLAGSATRKSRLHDEQGNLVSLSRLMRNGTSAVATGLLRLAFNLHPARPWISYDAQHLLSKFLNKNSRVLEFGSGRSTAWYSDHAGTVLSIEDNREWFELVSGDIAKYSNVTYRFSPRVEDYTQLPQGEFDLIMIDGSYRPECVEAALPHLASGGIVYLDNSDKNKGGLPGDVPRARKLLVDFAKSRNAYVTAYTDFAPGQLFVQEGLLVRL